MNPFRFSTLDFKLGARMMARYPGLTIVGTAAIAVAIALGTVYFEAVNKWKHPLLPIPDAARAISIRTWDVSGLREERRSLHDFAAWRAQLKTVDHLGAAVTFERNLATEAGQVEPVRGAEISTSAFAMLGTTPIKGRVLAEQDESPAQPPVALIGEAIWKSRFESDPNVLGRVVKVGTAPMTIVGVMPEDFGFPLNQQLWTPLRVDGTMLEPRTGPAVTVFGLLAPNASIEDARAELDVVGARMSASLPSHQYLRPRITIYEEPFGEGAQWRWFNGLLAMVNGVLLGLLAVVCINVATLVFARTATRGWEITVRTALGASRGRIVLQLFIEALMMTGLAAIVGLFVAKVAMRVGLQVFAGGAALPYWIDASLSLSTMLYSMVLALFGAAIVGILPALRVTRINVNEALRSEGAARSGLRFGGLWTTVIVVQVAITVAFLPLAANGMFASNRFQQRADGVGADGYIAARIDMDREDFRVDSATFAARAVARVEELERRFLAEPGVEGVAFADRLPVEDQYGYGITIDSTGLPATALRTGGATMVQVSRGFFDAFGTSVVAGRAFTPHDFEERQVLIVNESFAREVLEGRNPIGQRIRIDGGEDERIASEKWYEIVGMVKDFSWQLPEPEEQSVMYRPGLPIVGTSSQVAVRARDPEAFAARMRTIVGEVDPTIRLSSVQPLTLVGGAEEKRIRTLTLVAWVISFVILVLSATGIHALMAFTVARRTREIGIRVALGANARQIVRGIFSRAFMQVGIGLLVGSGLVALIGFGSARTLLLLLAADTIMLAVGLAACWLPLRRALRIDPTEALRAEG